jgi:ABC-type dipeptide/oligopeptide/nickel transport system ATPase component
MARRRSYTPEQIITKLREAEILLSQGKMVKEARKLLEISEQTYYRWRREYGGRSRFHTRCPHMMDICRKEEPQISFVDKEHWATCHLLIME